ncbi:zinc finger CCCH domain-containing protein 16-like [Chenopodium quinoa]|uniref:zinc finger CCCH domain-containing protein 16-like n=1 Tax=Chenopodium quinoa TaxID=63459 RepID=UPI000B782225|nr:zinc finger CCCH domain-containing protein 16-like [Chenopodium quinoa]
MPIKKEPCRNFLRGSCRFGDKCKFSHATQQQPKSNAFGFGSQTATPFQQQKPNPFGFGVQNSGSSGGFGQPNSNKPFENKWVRSEQPQNQSQAASHKCTDPDSCKRQIAEDFQNESPLWKLTCYGHFKYFPCDITGDISYEELRAVAYDDAKRGTSLQSIVERERGLVNSKKIEFENLLKNPYTKNTLPAQPNQSLFPAANASSPSPTLQNSGFSSFAPSNQHSPSPNLSFGVRPSTPSNSAFGQSQGPGPFGGNSAPSGPFGTQVSAQPGGILPAANKSGFGNSGMSSQGIFGTQVPAQPGGSFAANTSGFFGNSAMRGQEAGGNTFTPPAVGFGNIGMNNQGPQVPVQTGGAPITSNAGGFGNSGINSQGSQLPSTSSVSLDIQTPAVNNSTTTFNGFVGANGVQQTIDNNPLEISAVDASIWLKQEWKLGEIPEQPPPEAYVR